MLNIVVLQGRLTRDPEMRSTKNGQTVAGFTIACDRDWQPGGSEKLSDFIDCCAWRNTAGFVERNFRKGQLVCLKGRLQSRKWQDKQGQTRVSWEVEVDDCWFCGDRAVPPVPDPAKDMLYELPEDGPEGVSAELPF